MKIVQSEKKQTHTVLISEVKGRQSIVKSKASNTSNTKPYTEYYRRSVLGYRKARSGNLNMIDSAKRVAIIYDHSVHKKAVKQII